VEVGCCRTELATRPAYILRLQQFVALLHVGAELDGVVATDLIQLLTKSKLVSARFQGRLLT
jgi:hypothetical protein